MTESRIPVSGSLSARVIRACSKHNNKCDLNCPRRKVEDLGEIASFRSLPDPTEGLTTGRQPPEPGLGARLNQWLERITKPGGSA